MSLTVYIYTYTYIRIISIHIYISQKFTQKTQQKKPESVGKTFDSSTHQRQQRARAQKLQRPRRETGDPVVEGGFLCGCHTFPGGSWKLGSIFLGGENQS